MKFFSREKLSKIRINSSRYGTCTLDNSMLAQKRNTDIQTMDIFF